MSKESNIHKIRIEISGDEWKKVVDDTFKKVIKKTKIDGFRPGKAPRSVYEKKYGVEYLVSQAVEDYMQTAYEKALEKFDGTPIVRPTAEIDKEGIDGVTYVFTFVTKPEVTIKKYTNLGVKKEEVNVTDEDVSKQIDKIRQEYADLQVKDGKVEKGDTVIIDYEGFYDGKPFDGGKAENYSLEIGSNTFIPGFEDGLIGLSAGDEKDLNLTFPKDYHADELKGKEVVFKVKLSEVKRKVYPELNEDFFLDLGLDDVKTVDDLKKKIKNMMIEEKEYDSQNKFVDALFEALIKEVEVDIPHELIREEIDAMVQEYEQSLKMQGLTLKQYYKFTNSDEETLRLRMHKEAEKRVKLRFAINEIIELEKIDVTDEETEEYINKKIEEYKIDKDEYIKSFGGLEGVKANIKVEKVIDVLKK